jgi:hypothetical protein
MVLPFHGPLDHALMAQHHYMQLYLQLYELQAPHHESHPYDSTSTTEGCILIEGNIFDNLNLSITRDVDSIFIQRLTISNKYTLLS